MPKEKESDITSELESRFLTYALSTIVSRSLPDVRDGLKPIHRRILYAIHAMGVSADAKPVKSAKIIGEVLGKYHPHGDASTYESMVRMAQDFSMRYPLVDGKGNFGSMDGDAPAAYRYTEGRLTPITSYMLGDIKKDTVDFRANYDNTLKEPLVLPSQVPNLLINGSSGIAVGMACSFPSHNLTETVSALKALIKDRELTTTQLLKHIKGPDFPTEGILLSSKSEIKQAYETGQGALKVRGEWSLEQLPRGKTQIVLTAIPYGINKSRLIEKIAEIIIAKKVPGLVDVRDESDHRVRVVLELKGAIEAEKAMAYLFRHTDLETNIQINFNCLKPTGEPARLSLKEICLHFLDFRKEVVTRRLTYELNLIEKRLHILAAFAIIFKNLDKALKLIRSSKSKKEAGDKLKKAFKLDDEQTDAILEIPLYRLVSLEIEKILKEQKEKQAEQKRISGILKSEKKIWNEVDTELDELTKKFGDKRKTKLKANVEPVEFNAEDFIEHEDAVLVLSRNGWLRKLKSLPDPTTLKYKENDSLLGIVQANTRDLVVFFTSHGMVYVQKIFNLPYTRSGFGEPVQSLFKFGDGERVIRMFPLLAEGETPGDSAEKGQQQSLFIDSMVEPDVELLLAGTGGYGFRFPMNNLAETTRAGKRVMSLKGDDKMVAVVPIVNRHLFLITEAGKGMLIDPESVAQLSGTGRGVKLINVGESHLVGATSVGQKDKVTLLLAGGKENEYKVSGIPVYNRGSQGVSVVKRNKVVRVLG
ncbi:MAG: DNA topoisomerase IV subunit A [Nitrospina sp.]|nr:DNA topoisomerase IV subunit A [Nitrospina sp.]